MRTTLAAVLLAIVLLWDDNSDNEDGFNVEKTISGNCTEGWFKVAQTGVNIATWADDFGQPGDCYRVNALNAAGASSYSNVLQVPLPEPTPSPCKNPNRKGSKCR